MISTPKPRSGERWLRRASYAPDKGARSEDRPAAIERMSQEAFELAVSRELAGDCC
jgi:hypothetical protein